MDCSSRDIFEVPTDGEYTFAVTSSSKALLRIHNATVIDAGYDYFANSPKRGRVRLAAGLHPFRLYTIHGKKGKPAINLEWSGPGLANETITASRFFRAKQMMNSTIGKVLRYEIVIENESN